MANIVIPNSFVSGVVSRAGDVNTNFNVIASGLSDGTKDLNVGSVTATSVNATTATIGSLSFTDITAEDVTASGNLSVRSELHEMALSCPGVSGLVKIDNEWCASFKGDVMTVPSLVSNGAGTFSDNVSITSGTEKYLSVSQTGESSGEVRVTPYGIGTVNASALNLKTNDTTRVVIAGGGNVSIGGNFQALSPLHVSGNIRASGAIINGYTQLGGDAPAIKTLLITGTLPASGESQNYNITPITTTHNIISVSILASGDYAYQASTWNPPFRSGATVNYEYTLLSQPDFGVQVLQIRMGANCDTIENNPFKAFITYVA